MQRLASVPSTCATESSPRWPSHPTPIRPPSVSSTCPICDMPSSRQVSALYSGNEAHDRRVDAVGHAASMGRTAASQALRQASTYKASPKGRTSTVRRGQAYMRPPETTLRVFKGKPGDAPESSNLAPSATGRVEFQPQRNLYERSKATPLEELKQRELR